MDPGGNHWSGSTELLEAYREKFPETDRPHLMMCSLQDVHEAVMSGEDIQPPPGVVF